MKLTLTDWMRSSGSAAAADLSVTTELFAGRLLVPALALELLISSGCGTPRI